MNLKWKINENEYSQQLDMNIFLNVSEIPLDSNPWLGTNLLDVEAFRQYKKTVESHDDKEKEHYLEIIKQYEKIDNIIIESLADAVLIHTIYSDKKDEGDVVFERKFATLIKELAPQLHSWSPLNPDYIEVPTSNREDINQELERISLALLGDGNLEYRNGADGQKSRSKSTVQKDIIRNSIVRIAKMYSKESEKRYYALNVLCRKNNIRNLYSYDFAKVAVCTETALDYITNIEDAISSRIYNAFENRLILEDFQTGLSTKKINEINNYFSERDYIEKGKTHYDEMSKEHKKYFEKNKRCVAIMEFPNRDSDNMFALSGIELKSDKTYLSSFESLVANVIATELSLMGKYIFCRQNVLMRRYAHRKDYNTFIKLSQWNYLDNDTCWQKNKWDYACCERKFIAKLEMDNRSGAPFPQNIILWTRFTICDNCDYAITDYENSYNASIYVVK